MYKRQEPTAAIGLLRAVQDDGAAASTNNQTIPHRFVDQEHLLDSIQALYTGERDAFAERLQQLTQTVSHQSPIPLVSTATPDRDDARAIPAGRFTHSHTPSGGRHRGAATLAKALEALEAQQNEYSPKPKKQGSRTSLDSGLTESPQHAVLDDSTTKEPAQLEEFIFNDDIHCLKFCIITLGIVIATIGDALNADMNTVIDNIKEHNRLAANAFSQLQKALSRGLESTTTEAIDKSENQEVELELKKADKMVIEITFIFQQTECFLASVKDLDRPLKQIAAKTLSESFHDCETQLKGIRVGTSKSEALSTLDRQIQTLQKLLQDLSDRARSLSPTDESELSYQGGASAADTSQLSQDSSLAKHIQENPQRAASAIKRERAQQNQRLDEVTEESQQQIDQLEQQLADARETIDQLKKQITTKEFSKMPSETGEPQDGMAALKAQLRKECALTKELEEQLTNTKERYQALLTEKENIERELAELKKETDQLKPLAEASAIHHRTAMMSMTMGNTNMSFAAMGGMAPGIEEALNMSVAGGFHISAMGRARERRRGNPPAGRTRFQLTSPDTQAASAEAVTEQDLEQDSLTQEYQSFKHQEAILRLILGLAAVSSQLLSVFAATTSPTRDKHQRIEKLDEALLDLVTCDELLKMTNENPELKRSLGEEQKTRLQTLQSNPKSSSTGFSLFGRSSPAPIQFQSMETMARGVTKLQTMRMEMVDPESPAITALDIEAILVMARTFISTMESLNKEIYRYNKLKKELEPSKDQKTADATSSANTSLQKDRRETTCQEIELRVTSNMKQLPGIFTQCTSSVTNFLKSITSEIENQLCYCVVNSNLKRHALGTHLIETLFSTFFKPETQELDSLFSKLSLRVPDQKLSEANKRTILLKKMLDNLLTREPTPNRDINHAFGMITNEMLFSLRIFCSDAMHLLADSTSPTETELSRHLETLANLLQKLCNVKCLVSGYIKGEPNSEAARIESMIAPTTEGIARIKQDVEIIIKTFNAEQSDLTTRAVNAAHAIETSLITVYGYASKAVSYGPNLNDPRYLDAIKDQFLRDRKLQGELKMIPAEQLNTLVFSLLKKCCEGFVQGESLLNALCVGMTQLPAQYQEFLSTQPRTTPQPRR